MTDMTQVTNELLDLYVGLIIPYMKLRRDIPFPTEPERNETDGEHAFTLAILAITVAERLKLNLDSGLIAKYALVHDLVEAHAGDVSARASEEHHTAKPDKEHEAYLVIKQQYQEVAPWIPNTIESYEARSNPEALYVYAMDKCTGAFNMLAGDGARWSEFFPEADGSDYYRVVARLRKKAEAYPDILPLFDFVHDLLDQRRQSY